MCRLACTCSVTYAVSCYFVPCHAMLCRFLTCHAVSCLIVPCSSVDPCRTVPCRAMPYRTVPCHAMPYRAMPCRAVSCHAMPCRAVPYRTVNRTVPYRAVPCRAVPCHVNCHVLRVCCFELVFLLRAIDTLTPRTSVICGHPGVIRLRWQSLIVPLSGQTGDGKTFHVVLRFDTEVELTYHRHGGILNYMVRKML